MILQPISRLRKYLAENGALFLSEISDKNSGGCYMVGESVRDFFLARPTNIINIFVTESAINMSKTFLKYVKNGEIIAIEDNNVVYIKGERLEFKIINFKHTKAATSLNYDVTRQITSYQKTQDFTINSMAINLQKEYFGELEDPFGGYEDLKEGIIRTTNDPMITFVNDAIQMINGIRLATTFNYKIEDETFHAMQDNANNLKFVRTENMIAELNKIILSPVPSIGFVYLHNTGLLKEFLPELSALDIVETFNGRKHKNNFYHTLEVLDNIAKREGNLWLRWAAILHDIGKTHCKRWDPVIGWTFHNHNFIGEKMVPGIFKRLKLPMDDRMRFVKKLVGLHMRPIAIADDIVTDSAVRRLLFEAGNDINSLMLLCEADITSKNEMRKKKFLQNFKIVREKLAKIEEKDRIRKFQPPVDGIEIMKMFNLQPCKEIGIIKGALKDAIIDGKIPNERDAALDFVIKKAASIGLSPITFIK